jgi:hypothetical protein
VGEGVREIGKVGQRAMASVLFKEIIWVRFFGQGGDDWERYVFVDGGLEFVEGDFCVE